jgi:hypothetical protein
MPLGATVLFGEYGQYNDQFSGLVGDNVCSSFLLPTQSNIGQFCFNGPINPAAFPVGVFVTGSEVQRFGLGVVQEIDSAAMHLFARWQHQEVDVDFVALTGDFTAAGIAAGVPFSTQKINQSFDDWDLFQVGGIIFF